MSATPLSRDAFLTLCEENSGLTEDIAAVHGWSKDAFLEAANRLLTEGRINVFTTPDNKIMCRIISQHEKYKSLSEQDKLVLDRIKDSADKGLSAKDIAHKTNLATKVVNRCTALLEKKDLIKPVKSIQSKRGKLWMLFDVTPSKEIAGGSWYKDGEIDWEKIRQMREEILRMLKQRVEPQTAESLSASYDRDESDVQRILNVLELDGEISATGDTWKTKYKIRNEADILFQCGDMPCFSCPVRKQCTPKPAGPNVPTPRNCEYFTKWLYGGTIWDQESPPLLPALEMDIEDM
eukprot:GEMP01044716.1.p1 GENE.GEMP01044716.1~~GEMP01044716.1.p1  ORF type:complete len:293 (-),score=46.40 GEMP01044716.1:873-1751(-)